MQLAARSYVTAAAALAAGSMIAANPAASSTEFQTRAVELVTAESDLAPDLVFADPLLQLQAEEVSFNAALVSQEEAANATVSAGGDFNTLFAGTAENLFNSVLGADNFDPGVATDGFGGLRGVMDLSLFAVTDAVRSADDETKVLTGVEGTLPFPSDAELALLQSDELTACQALFQGELAFNSNLLHSEVGAELAAFGSNNALNGLVDRLINADNLILSTGENALNSLFGVETVNPSAITASLLTGVGGSATDPTNVFDTGYLGGLEGFFDQNLAGFTDIAGLTPTQISDAFAPGVFDPAGFTTAIDSAIETTAFSPFLADLTPVFTDFTTILSSFF
jgi:hypothetical protein